MDTFVERVHKTLELSGLIGLEEKFTSVNDWIKSTNADVNTVVEEVLDKDHGLKRRMGVVEVTATEAKQMGLTNVDSMNELKSEVNDQMTQVQTEAGNIKQECMDKIKYINGEFDNMKIIMDQNGSKMNEMETQNKELEKYIGKMDQMNESLSENNTHIEKVEAKMEKLDEAMLGKIVKNKSAVDNKMAEMNKKIAELEALIKEIESKVPSEKSTPRM